MDVHEVDFVGSYVSLVGMPPTGLPEVGFVGRSNVGKSSLINMMLGRRSVARTSSHPGKTRTMNFFLVDGSRHFVDLPGLGYAKVSKTQRSAWSELISSYLTLRQPLRLIIQLIDARHGITAVDDELLEIVGRSGASRVLTLTKADKLSRNKLGTVMSRVDRELTSRGLEVPIVATSATRKSGRDELWQWIEDLA